MWFNIGWVPQSSDKVKKQKTVRLLAQRTVVLFRINYSVPFKVNMVMLRLND
jgi:hypothetical protein